MTTNLYIALGLFGLLNFFLGIYLLYLVQRYDRKLRELELASLLLDTLRERYINIINQINYGE